MGAIIDLAGLNRATLVRQGLLERVESPVVDVVARAGGLQAQSPQAPAIGLWSRIEGFGAAQLVEAAASGELVRGTTLRMTLHLHTADDYRALRAAMQPQLDRFAGAASMLRRLGGADPDEVLRAGRVVIEQGASTIGEVKDALRERFPNAEPQALGNVVRMRMQLLMQPDPDAPFGWPNVARFVPATSLAGELAPAAEPREVLSRFLAALGPGTARDAQVWSGVSGLAAAAKAMLASGELIELTTHDGRDLFDLPDAPRPPGETPAAARFLPMWDNVLLSHHDRSRVMDPRHRGRFTANGGMPPPAFLVDGFVHGTWSIERHGSSEARLQLDPFATIPAAARDALVHEGEALLGFLHPTVERRTVRLG